MLRESKRKPSLLLVDGSEEMLASGIDHLIDSGFAVHCLRDGNRALERLEQEPFDLVLLDAEPQDPGGLDLLSALRKRHPPDNLPVILATPPEEEDLQVQAFALGVDDCIPKPLDWKITVARIHARLRPRRGLPRAEETLLAGRYRLDTLLGRGHQGTVWRALDLETGRSVAVKRLSNLASSADRERFASEGPILCHIPHPNAVTVLDLCDNTSPPALVMELLEGTTLDTVLRQGALPLHRIVALLVPLCSVLDFAHGRGIVHCDLKPNNIFLHREKGEEVPKVLDFGIARWTDGTAARQSRNGLPAGTPAYLAPERILGTSYDGRADVYSLGVLLYEMLSSSLPFTVEDGNILHLLHQHTQRPPPPLESSVPRNLRQLVARCLAKKPEERPTARELGHLLPTVCATENHLAG